MADAIQQQFNIKPPDRPDGAGASMPGTHVTNIPGEVYETYVKIIDPDGIYLNKLSRLLWNCYLVKSDEFDPRSPVPSYKLVEIGDKEEKKMMSWTGYNTITNNFILYVSEVISTTEFDEKGIDLRQVCFDGTWAIMSQPAENWDIWEFRDEGEIETLGIAIWFNLYSVSRRSTNGGKMLGFLTNLFKHLGNKKNEPEEDRHKVKFWKNPTSG